MATADNLQITLTDAELKRVNDAVAVLEEVLGPKLIALSGAEIRRLPKPGDASLPFIDKSLDLAEQQPQFAPAYLDISGLRLDLVAYRVLSSIGRRLQPLTDNLNATTIKLSSEAYVTALAYYNAAQQAQRQNVSGAQAVVESLKERFEVSAARKSKARPQS